MRWLIPLVTSSTLLAAPPRIAPTGDSLPQDPVAVLPRVVPPDAARREALAKFGQALLMQKDDRILSAQQTLERAVRLDPAALDPRRALIPLYIAAAREEDALRLCAEILAIDPDDYATARQQARIYRSLDRPSEAVAAMTVAAKSKNLTQPDREFGIRLELAALQERAKAHAGVVESLERVLVLLKTRREAIVLSGSLTFDDIPAAEGEIWDRIMTARIALRQFPQALEAVGRSRDAFALVPPKSDKAISAANRLSLSYWQMCEILTAQEKPADALAALNEHLKARPRSIAAYQRKVDLLRELDRAAEIVPMLREYAERDNSPPGIRVLLATALAADANFADEAERLWLSLEKTAPSPEVYKGLFRLWIARDRTASILEMLDEANKAATPKADVPATDGQLAASVRTRAMFTAIAGDRDAVEGLLTLATSEARQKSERSVRTWHLLADLAGRTGRLDRAETLFRQCLIDCAPDAEAEIYIGLLEVLRSNHRPEAAVKLCREALGDRGGPGRARFTNPSLFYGEMGIALGEMGRFTEAVERIDVALKTASDFSRIRLRTSKARMYAYAGKPDEGIRECRSLLEDFVAPSEVRQIRYTLASIYALKRDRVESEKQYRTLIESDPTDATAHNDLGYQMAERSQDLPEAERLIRRAIELDRRERETTPLDDAENAAYLDSLGWVLFRRGKLPEAREALERAAKLFAGRNDGTVWDHLGDVCFRQNEPAAAKSAWEKAVRLYEFDNRAKKEGRIDELRRKLKVISDK